MSQSAPSLRRPDSAERRAMILAVAREVFWEKGFEGAAMNEVAARLGGSKGTLYAYFDSKEALFAGVVVENCGRMGAQLFEGPTDAPLVDRLTGFARAYTRLITSDFANRLLQILAQEAPRRPELGRIFYEAGPAIALERLSAIIGAAAAAGELVVDDADEAAEVLAALCRGKLHLKRMLGQVPEPDAATVARTAERAVEQFLKLYRN